MLLFLFHKLKKCKLFLLGVRWSKILIRTLFQANKLTKASPCPSPPPPPQHLKLKKKLGLDLMRECVFIAMTMMGILYVVKAEVLQNSITENTGKLSFERDCIFYVSLCIMLGCLKHAYLFSWNSNPMHKNMHVVYLYVCLFVIYFWSCTKVIWSAASWLIPSVPSWR